MWTPVGSFKLQQSSCQYVSQVISLNLSQEILHIRLSGPSLSLRQIWKSTGRKETFNNRFLYSSQQKTVSWMFFDTNSKFYSNSSLWNFKRGLQKTLLNFGKFYQMTMWAFNYNWHWFKIGFGNIPVNIENKSVKCTEIKNKKILVLK